MIAGKTVLAVVPARAGSVRVQGKNLRPMLGRPLILWTIDEAKQSRYIDRIAVTTDDRTIVAAVANHGLEIVTRPDELATSQASIYDAIFHCLDQLQPYDYTVLLQPTSPLRVVGDIDGAIYRCWKENAPSCVSIDPTRPVANGAVYVAWTTWLREMRNFDAGRVVTYMMPAKRSIDIDTIDDFRTAEALARKAVAA